jgi:hypothetical protein
LPRFLFSLLREHFATVERLIDYSHLFWSFGCDGTRFGSHGMISTGPVLESKAARARHGWRLLCVSFGIAFFAVGCGEEAGRRTNARNYTQTSARSLPSNSVVQLGNMAGEAGSADKLAPPVAPGEAPAPADVASNVAPPRSTRKIIYDGRIELKVDSLAATQQAVMRLIEQFRGFLSDSEQSSLTEAQPHASWKVRVPVDQFHGLVAAVAKLGEVHSNRVGSQDVTEEFFDVEARIRNKQEEEKRLLKILADATGRLKDILEIERELSRVRGEVERVQGRLRFLSDQTELSTLTIDATEWKDYKPPMAPTFPTVVSRTFFGSVENLASFGKAVLLFLVAVLPWLPIIAVGLLILRWLVKWGQVPIDVRFRQTGAVAGTGGGAGSAGASPSHS